ncbi:MAG: type IV pilus modification protein PilV [Thiobacillaceae bacterium]
MAICRSIRQLGFTLVEVLVSLLVLTIGLLALAALQSHSMKSTHSAYLRTQASQYAYDILDRMRANREAARAEAYDLALTDATPVCGASAPLVDCDRAEWRADLASLPGGTGAIDYDPASEMVTVLVQWNDERAGGTTTTTFTLQSRL